MYVPKDYGTVFPYMIVSDADKYAEFLSQVFSSEEMGRTVFPDGRIANIRVRVGWWISKRLVEEPYDA